jgi:PHD/YefM family antitoxin component YafN of YafNO toxin-antitoxin module
MPLKRGSIRGHRIQMRDLAAPVKSSGFAAQAKAMEEEVEFSNVTNFRNSLLGAVEQLHSNPAKRYVITKRGAPEAVLMSYKTYSLLTRVMNQALEKTETEDRGDSVHAAFDRMRREHQPRALAENLQLAASTPEHPEHYDTTAVSAAAAPADAAPHLANLIEQFEAIRGTVNKFEDLLKQQEWTARPPATKPTIEK